MSKSTQCDIPDNETEYGFQQPTTNIYEAYALRL